MKSVNVSYKVRELTTNLPVCDVWGDHGDEIYESEEEFAGGVDL